MNNKASIAKIMNQQNFINKEIQEKQEIERQKRDYYVSLITFELSDEDALKKVIKALNNNFADIIKSLAKF